MPYAKCPVCGSTFHLQVTDIGEWYRNRYPSLPFGSIVPATCFFCWPEIKEGDRVVVRKIICDDQIARLGEKGTVKSILGSDDGSIFIVVLDSQKEASLIRAEFRKLRESEA
jgi:hypothetical protein